MELIHINFFLITHFFLTNSHKLILDTLLKHEKKKISAVRALLNCPTARLQPRQISADARKALMRCNSSAFTESGIDAV